MTKEVLMLKRMTARDTLSVETVMLAEKFRAAWLNAGAAGEMPPTIMATIAVLSGAMDGSMVDEELEQELDGIEVDELAEEPELADRNVRQPPRRGPGRPRKPVAAPKAKKPSLKKSPVAQSAIESTPEAEEPQDATQDSSEELVKGRLVNIRVKGGGWKNARFHSVADENHVFVTIPNRPKPAKVKIEDMEVPDLEKPSPTEGRVNFD